MLYQVSVYTVGARHRLPWVAKDLDRARPAQFERLVHDGRVWLVAVGAREAQVDPKLRRRQRQRVRHVVPVAHVRQSHTLERAAALVQGQQVGQDLTRVLAVTERVDDWYRCVFGESGDVGVQKDTGHDGINVPTQHTCRVDHALALAKLDFGRRQIDRVSAEVQHRDFEGHPRTQ